MSDPFLGEIKMWAFEWAPQGWALCNGALLPIQQYSALFALLGTNFGGDGRTTFALPDLRGRAPVALGAAGQWPSRIGDTGGTETVSLTWAMVPPHYHRVVAYPVKANKGQLTNCYVANAASANPSSTTDFSVFLPATTWTAQAQLHMGTIPAAGGSGAHNNMQPFVAVNYCICTMGYFPPRQ